MLAALDSIGVLFLAARAAALRSAVLLIRLPLASLLGQAMPVAGNCSYLMSACWAAAAAAKMRAMEVVFIFAKRI